MTHDSSELAISRSTLCSLAIDVCMPTVMSHPSLRPVRRRIFALVLGFVTAHAFATPASQDVALEFVKAQRLGDNLSALALTTASRTQTYSMLVSKLGADQARVVTIRELDALLPNYQSVWNLNLASVYAKHFSVEELRSLAAEGRRSQFANKVVERQSQIGNDVRSLSQPLLIKYVTEAMKIAFEKSTKQ